ncbi:hypothetical protein [Polynucleobacter necessarius]|uniref:hypothetical protein n=1 Tax=Polynucleobacter necessarius TaxID=576610 RepID=UPI001E4ED809|nr:hypothetical protein [Polynucleobacter necessarius]
MNPVLFSMPHIVTLSTVTASQAGSASPALLQFPLIVRSMCHLIACCQGKGIADLGSACSYRQQLKIIAANMKIMQVSENGLRIFLKP